MGSKKDLNFLASAKIGTNGRMTIPREVRDALNLRVGDYLGFFEEDGKIVVKNLKKMFRGDEE